MPYVLKSTGRGASGLPIEAKIKALAARLDGKTSEQALEEAYKGTGRELPKKPGLTLSGWRHQIQTKLDEEGDDGSVGDLCVSYGIVEKVEKTPAKKARAKK